MLFFLIPWGQLQFSIADPILKNTFAEYKSVPQMHLHTPSKKGTQHNIPTLALPWLSPPRHACQMDIGQTLSGWVGCQRNLG